MESKKKKKGIVKRAGPAPVVGRSAGRAVSRG